MRSLRIVFRRFHGSESGPPNPGEIVVRPHASVHRDRGDFASLLLEHGISALRRGAEPWDTIVVSSDPTLDDMLTATLIEHVLKKRKLPEGIHRFAQYTAAVREGLSPIDVAPQASLEAVFLAMRSRAGDDLIDPAAGESFADNWQRMARVIMRAAEEDVDPFTASLFDDHSDFGRECVYLARDRDVFFQDVERGERWRINMPGGSPDGMALFLRSPKSLLYKLWSRRPHPTTQKSYEFLAVSGESGRWTFATDPVYRISLKPLADELQTAEKAHDPAHAAANPWFDGRPFRHSLIASPLDGTRLQPNAVLKVVKTWLSASDPAARPIGRMAGMAAAAVVLLVVGIGLLVWSRGDEPTGINGRSIRFQSLVDSGTTDVATESQKGRMHILAIGVSKYQKPEFSLAVAHEDADALAKAFRHHGTGIYEAGSLALLQNEKAKRDEVVEALAKLSSNRSTQPEDIVIVTISGHGAQFDNANDYYFLPHDFNPDKCEATAIHWGEIQRLLNRLPCRVFLILDTCHSGSATKNLHSVQGQNDSLERKVKSTSRGLIVMAACVSSEKAQERSEWGHGALTLAVLEALSGKHRVGNAKTGFPRIDDEWLNLQDLNYYVTRRVRELSNQEVISNQSGDLSLSKIMISKWR